MKRDTGPNALRRGRASAGSFDYFLTLCVNGRKAALRGRCATEIMKASFTAEGAGIWELRCATIMPDHIHMLVRLGSILTLSQAVARLKVATKTSLALQSAQWQANYYDHRIRSDDAIEPVIRYIHSNPYGAELLRTGEIWPWFYCDPNDWNWFSQLTDLGRPFPEWLQ